MCTTPTPVPSAQRTFCHMAICFFRVFSTGWTLLTIECFRFVQMAEKTCFLIGKEGGAYVKKGGLE
jgi:hypothetical protein